ncbi:MAG: NAD(+)/NADH kinase [Melioribacteraceae bacterium]|nr:NAD(+)/NADH kinase [Melioribacteraceae bacterium]
MKIGIIPNTTKHNIIEAVEKILLSLKKYNVDALLGDTIYRLEKSLSETIKGTKIIPEPELIAKSDFVVSLGGDGTMLNTSFEAKDYDTPILGVNVGKLGFLAEFDFDSFDAFIPQLLDGNYLIEDRIALEAVLNEEGEKLFALNDIVIDKGYWPKMIELNLAINGEFVSTFAADGLIIATPTGSTGYALSAGGPIVSPKSNVITIIPIAPHTLTMRPLVLDSNEEINVEVKSGEEKIQINCDGQRVNFASPPLSIKIKRSSHPIRLVHSKEISYFQVLRNKLYWGIDARNNQN